MDGIKVGDRVVPLPDSPQYGPKRWVLTVAPDGKRTWTEIPMSQVERDFDRMESALAWESNTIWTRTEPITQEQVDKYNLPESALDGFAVFPAAMFYPPGKEPEAVAARVRAEDLWMAHYRVMEANQTIIRPPEKPEENLLAKISLERAD